MDRQKPRQFPIASSAAFRIESSPMPHTPANNAGRSTATRDGVPVLAAGFIVVASAILYALTPAPTVLWGDDAMFQQALAQGTLTNHPLWGLLARLFARLPVGDLAFRANVASAVYAVGAVGFLFLATLTVSGSVRAAVAAGAALAVSHTFWLQAVRAEVYTLHMLLFLAGLWAILRWRQTQHTPPIPRGAVAENRDGASTWGNGWLALGLLFWGAGTVNHLLLTMALPGGLWLILSALSPSARKRAVLFSPLAMVAAALLLYVLQPAFLTDVVPAAAQVVLTTFSLSLSRLAMHLVVLIYQFPVLGLLALPGFVHLWQRDRSVAVSLCLMAVLTAAFASTHGILESYAFYLPVFGLIALVAGVGVAAVAAHWPSERWLAVGLVLIALQIGLYRVTPVIVQHIAPGIIPSRDLPGRQASTFFLWPPKRGYLGARQFAQDTLDVLPADAMLIADWTIFAPLRYLQDVEGQRRDVVLVQVDPLGMQAIRANNGRRALFLANADPRYYPLDEFNERFVLRPVGSLLALQLRDTERGTEYRP